MDRRVTAQRVWDDIEFELIQGLPSRDELGQSIRVVQRHQNTLRAQVFGEGRRMDQREIVARLFQINDMLLTLLQETATELRKVQLDVERISRARHDGLAVAQPAAPATPAGGRATEDTVTSPASPVDADVPADGYSRPLSDVELAMRPDALEVHQHEGRQVPLPLAGGMITRLKRAFHRLVHFYIRLLGEKQAAVNLVYGEWILYQVRLGERQRDQLVRLGRRLAALEGQEVSADSPRAPEGPHDRPRKP
jgi:hypothetical protein